MAARKNEDEAAGAAAGAAAGERPEAQRKAVVGIGASAGGIEAYKALVANLPTDSGISWVLIQHMAPDRESYLATLLEGLTSMPVVQVMADTAVEPNHVYVIAPGRIMTLVDGVLHPVENDSPMARRSSIDAFLLSLAEQMGESCGCALLSGAGTDGTLGLKAVKEAGGLTLTQEQGTAQYDSMLMSALRTGLVDQEMPVENMGRAFADFCVDHHDNLRDAVIAGDQRQRITTSLRRLTDHDFSGYKTSTLDRRIRRRMQINGMPSVDAYLEHFEGERQEALQLFRDLLIGVTQFFRDAEAFEALRQRVIPALLENKTADDEIRVWVAGCATGEEAYSLAMLFQEAAEQQESMPQLKIFGSDIDEQALHVARVGRYPLGIAADISPERLDRFFDKEDGTYCVRSRLREMCLFAQHNLLRDPPFSRIDLLACRNVLIYMNADLQRRLLPVFHYALKPGGFLLLGPAENVSHSKLFAEVDRKQRVFRRIGGSSRLPEFPIVIGDPEERRVGGARPTTAARPDQASALRNAIARYAPAYVVIDQDFDIIEASAGTGAYLELPSGRPNVNLAAMVRSNLALDVKAAVGKVMATGEPEVRRDIVFGSGADRKRLLLAVERITTPGRPTVYLVVFQEAPAPSDPLEEGARPQSDDDEVRRALEIELQSTRERLQTTAEELETSNEELRASNEELSSVNEELQSANEELETSKEELQSINEELRTVNAELISRVEELSRANSDLKNLFANTQISMLFLDEDCNITNFTPSAKPLFRLRDHDLGRPLDELAGPLDHQALKADIARVTETQELIEREVEADQDGERQTFLLRILPYRDEKNVTRGTVLTYLDITQRKHSEERLASMVAELNHRVKNTLASVQAIVRFSAANAHSAKDLESILEGRLRAMATAHGILSDADWQRADLRGVAQSILAPFADARKHRLSLDGPPVELRAGVAVSMSLMLHELATNAAKYGAWSSTDGGVELVWSCTAPPEETLTMIWREHDGPPCEPPEKSGFGLTFIKHCVAHEMHGTSDADFSPEGLRYRFDVPTNDLVWCRAEAACAG